MKPTKRALRRHHRRRMIRRALRAYAAQGVEGADARRQWAVRWHDHLAMCSCWMCGNPRKHLGEITVQEKRQRQAARADASEDRGTQDTLGADRVSAPA